MSARTPEGTVKDGVRKLLAAHGAWYCMPFGNLYGRSGVPDFVICHEGRFLAVETKSAGGKPTVLQKLEMGKIGKAGGSAMVIRPDNMNELEEWLNATSKASWKPRILRRRRPAGGADPGGESGDGGGSPGPQLP